jgi:Condensation domain
MDNGSACGLNDMLLGTGFAPMHNESLQHIALACANRTSRTARLTCGQRYIWKVIRALSGIETLNVPVTFDVENPQDVATISDKIAWFVERRAALRTTFPIGDDGNPQQVLHTEGHIPLTIVESDTDGLPATLARLVSTFEALPFDMASDLPLRSGILTSNGEPKSVVLCFSHMVVDGWSANLVQEEFFKVLNDGAGSANWPDDWSPFDQAEWERSPEGGEVLEESLDHWRRAIAQFPRAVFHHAVAQETTQRWRGAEINSAAMGIAARFLADQHKVSTATVLLVSLSLILSPCQKVVPQTC